MEFIKTTALIFFNTAPFLVLGLFLVGWLTVIVPGDRINRYMGKGNLKSAFVASLLGLPLPLCSCSVIPVALGLKKKGASREATLSFLISTPETSVDTVILSWGILGPFMAIVRPITAFVTSMFASIFSIAERTDRPLPSSLNTNNQQEAIEVEETLLEGVGLRKLGAAFFIFLRQLAHRLQVKFGKEVKNDDTVIEPSFSQLCGSANRHGFVSIFDSLSGWFVLGIILAGFLASFVPDNWLADIPGGELTSMLLMILIGIPMYVCALESTPIAAVLIAKGLSPGAAIVFLLVGPATNISSLILLLRSFGKRFLFIYLSSIISVSLAAGYLSNKLISIFDIPVALQFMSSDVSTFWTIFSWITSIGLIILIIFSFRRKNWNYNYQIVKKNLLKIIRFFKLIEYDKQKTEKVSFSKIIFALFSIGLAIFIISGVFTVPPGSEAFISTFGRLTRTRVESGLHYHLPPPIQSHIIYPVKEVRVVEVGYRLDEDVLKKWRNNTLTKSTVGWHSFFTTMKTDHEVSNYLLGDENQVEAKFSLHFKISNPVKFFFNHIGGNKIVGRLLESSLKDYFADSSIDKIMTTGRGTLESDIENSIQIILDQYDLGVEVINLYAVDLHPPVEAVSAFRDVASAMEDRQTLIHEAYTSRASALPLAKGKKEEIVKTAAAYAETVKKESLGVSESFNLLETSYDSAQESSRFVITLESMEQSLPGKNIYIVPTELLDKSKIRFWPSETPLIGGQY